MKNILKKIGLIAIIVGVLSPFITLPSVNAETCDTYLNKYLFLDELVPGGFENYESGYTTYTSFHYNFPNLLPNETIEIISANSYELNDFDELEAYHGQIFLLKDDPDKTIEDIENKGAWKEELYTGSGYKTITSMLHGIWSKDDTEAKPSGWNISEDFNTFKTTTLQGLLLSKNKYSSSTLEITFGGAKYTSSSNSFQGAGNYTTNVKNFLQKILNDYKNNIQDSINSGYVYNNDQDTYVNFRVNRKLSASKLNQLHIGYKDTTNNKYYVWSTTDTNDITNVTNSYTAFKDYISNENVHKSESNDNKCISSDKTCYRVETTNSDQIDIFTNESYFWPAVLNVEYKICTTSQTVDPTPSNPDVKWNLKYNANVNDNSVKNVPDNLTGQTGNSVKLSDTKPERTDYVFKAWCTEKDGKGTCKNSGELLLNEEMKDMELFAQWQKAGTEENDKKGVMSYIIGFLTVGLIAGTLYYVINKKNLFKQI